MSRTDKLLRQAAQRFNAGDIAGAEQAFAEAARLAPNAWQIHFNLGMCRDRLGLREGAFLAYQAAHRLFPDHVPCLTNLAVSAFNLGKTELALQLTLRQVELEPGNALAYDNLGQIFRQLGQYQGAELAHRNATLLTPEAPTLQNNLGLVLMDQNKLPEAEKAFLLALDLAPDHVDAMTNLSCIYQSQGRLEEAQALCRRAIELAAQSPVTWTNLGNTLKAMGQYQEALEAQQRAVELAPQYALAHWNYAMSLLALGRLKEGWREYEWGAAAGARTRFSDRLPRWQGEALAGRHLLLRAEQGLGDSLQFLRFARHLEGRGAKVTLECQPALLPLLTGLAGIDRVVAQEPDLPGDAFGCDLYLPLMSLPGLLDIELQDLPGPIPYLAPPAERVARWQAIVPPPLGKLRVGLVWAGNPRHRNDHQRSCPMDALAPLLALPGIDFFSLQMPSPGKHLPAGIRDITPGIGDFADTAALLENLDLLIAVDTAVVHLAGALGRPAWILLAQDADWRWLHDRKDSPWYPSIRLYRQKMPGQWLPLLETVASDLQAVIAAGTQKLTTT